ncbi:ABC transporter substrate-binding protein [Desulfobacterium sp. N47]|uniref:ABC transporter substrate-binding protein n=1 Tax=Desulfobacterium sp. N47 TaxID=3115210 RepID=UPI003CA9BC84
MMRKGHNDNGAKSKIGIVIITLLFLVLSCTGSANAREITDMFGKKVSVADRPQKVYSTFPPVTCMLYAIDPGMLAGLNFPVKEEQKRYLRKSMQELPILGGWFGQGQVPNLEMILKINPEIIVASKNKFSMNDKIDKTLKTMPMPVINVTLNTLSDYPEAFLYLGRMLGREARAEELAAYAGKTLSEMAALAASVPAQKKVSVYYAEGIDGLSTECDTSWHAELISLAGGQNVHRCQIGSLYGMEKVNLEQIILYNPDVILVMEPAFYRTVFSDPKWQRVKAVQNKRVYLIPREPFNWFDRPPSFMCFVGVKWVARLLYPDRYKVDIVKESQQFFRLFLGMDVSNDVMKRVIYQ